MPRMCRDPNVDASAVGCKHHLKSSCPLHPTYLSRRPHLYPTINALGCWYVSHLAYLNAADIPNGEEVLSSLLIMPVPFEALLPYGIVVVMFGVSGASLSWIRNFADGGRRPRHGMDAWDRVC